MREFRDAVEKRLAGLKLAPEREAEILEEIVSHLEDRHRELVAGGLSSEAATRFVFEDLDKDEALGRELRSTEERINPDAAVFGAHKTNWQPDLWHDLVYGLRSLRKKPGLTAIAVVTLALGIGANTAIFSVINAVVLRPLAGPNPEQLMMIWESRPREHVTDNTVSPADFVDWKANQRSFEDIAAVQSDSMDLTGSGEPERLLVSNVSPSFFNVLGAVPALGRDFLPDEDRGNHVVILSHALWQRRFGGDPSIVGRAITLNGMPYDVIGVLPPGDEPSALFYPLDFTAQPMQTRTNHFLVVFARLKPGITIEQAQADMDRIAAQIEKGVPGGNQGHGASVISAHEKLVGNVRRPLNVLAAAVGFVLLIACANVANLLLARGVAWQRELAIRHALGSSRARMVRQFSMECLWLAVLGAAAGLPIAVFGTDLLKAIAPADIPRLAQASLDIRVMGYMVALTLLTAVIAGIGPALQVARIDPNEALKTTSPSAGGPRRLFRNGLIVSEIALAFVLLAGAGLMTRSLLNILNVDPGFNAANVLTMNVSVSALQTRNKTADVFVQELLDRVRSVPGVTDVGLTSHLPMSGADARMGIVIEGRTPDPNQPTRIHPRYVTTDLFHALKVQLLEGRLPTEEEVQKRSFVAVINRTAALRYWPGQSPIGKRMRMGGADTMHEVIGVVADIKHWGFRDELGASGTVDPEAFVPSLRSRGTLVIRTQSNPLASVGAIREQVRQLDPNLPLSDIRTMEEVMGRTVTAPRFYLILLSVFGIVAAILAAAGIYGVISYTVAQSTRDIGVRIALGAKPADVLRGVLRQGLVLSIISLAIGFAASLGLTRLMGSLLFGVKATDPITFAAMAIVTVAVALLACYLPARRAASVDPILALRHQ